MGQVRHGCATTTHTIRAAIQRSQAATVREICGGISDMSLWRWLNDPALDFPRAIYIARRRDWRQAEILAWLDNRAAAQAEVA